MAALEHARLASETKLMYINTFVQPVAAQESTYPKRPLDMLIVVAACMAVWGVALGLLTLVRGGIG